MKHQNIQWLKAIHFDGRFNLIWTG